MSIKTKVKVIAAAAALTIVGGVTAAGTMTASAATPSCGRNCVDLFAKQFGTHAKPNSVVDVLKQGIKAGQPLILFRTANYDPAEDWTAAYEGNVSDFYAAGMVTSALALHYGCSGMIAVAGAQIPCSAAAHDDYAFEIEYAPYGVDSGLCMGLAATATQGEGVSLQPCGVSSTTVWVIDQADSSTGRMTPVLKEYVPLINGSDTNFSHPFVLTYPANSVPTDMPRAQLTVTNLTGFSNGTGGDPQGVTSNQLWGADLGTLS